MIAAIASGLLAIVGTVVGGVIAGGSAARTVAQQLNGESARSRAEFLRSQRQVLYAKILEHQAAVVITQRQLSNVAYLSSEFPDYKIAAEKQSAALAVLDRDQFEIAILAGTVTRASLAALVDAERQNAQAIDFVAQECSGDSVTVECNDARDEKSRANAQVEEALKRLISGFRDDLGID